MRNAKDMPYALRALQFPSIGFDPAGGFPLDWKKDIVFPILCFFFRHRSLESLR